jgi:DNA segregation ATPase FtsK/SpoIIIE, S-DNA-T family
MELEEKIEPNKIEIIKSVVGISILILSIAFFISFISYFFYWQEDQSQLGQILLKQEKTENFLGKIGAVLGDVFVYRGNGIMAFYFPILLGLIGIRIFYPYPISYLKKYLFKGLFFLVWTPLLLSLLAPNHIVYYGILGFEMNDYLLAYMGEIGIILILLLSFIIYLVIEFKIEPAALHRKKIDPTPTSEENSNENKIEETDNIFDKPLEKEENEFLDQEIKLTRGESISFSEIESKHITLKINPIEPTEDLSFEEMDEGGEALSLVIKNPIKETLVVKNVNVAVEKFGEFDPKLELPNFKFPPLDLLTDFSKSENLSINQAELERNKDKIVETLNNYSIGISEIKATIGPTVTLYEIIPTAGIRIARIKNLEDDIALSLSALGIRIIAPIPGKGTIGIEVPNSNPSTVSMRSVIASQKFQNNNKMELPLALGKTISNETFITDLAKMPHLLMAGATGQGKSVGLNAIISSLLFKKHPSELKFVFVDPKKVELTLYNKIERHYLAKLPGSEDAIITDNMKVIHTLNSLCIEMDRRYDLLKDAFVRNIKEYNEKFKERKLNPENGHQYLPYIVLVVDEFADLIMTAGKEVELPIARLAQLARAIGIHLIIATQRPSVNVITGMIKANFPARIAFRVTSKIDSRTILDASGADQLIGKGDMLFTTGNELVRIQCAFIDTPEVEEITEFIGNQKGYPDAYLLPEFEGENERLDGVDLSQKDALFDDAARILVSAQQGSASLLQRKLKIGYNRAGRLIDELESAGIVGPFEGSKARQILISDINSLEQILTTI